MPNNKSFNATLPYFPNPYNYQNTGLTKDCESSERMTCDNTLWSTRVLLRSYAFEPKSLLSLSQTE